MKKLILLLTILHLASCSSDESPKPTPEPKLGEEYKGGVVFYILKEGDPSFIEGETHGFIVGEDLPNKFIWGCSSAPGDMGEALGDGEINTSLIANACPGENAASACLEDGWYLPTVEEMKKMFQNKLLFGASSSVYYWTCNKHFSNDAYIMRFSDGTFDWKGVNATYNVKPIKRF